MKDETIDNCLKTLYLVQKQKGSANGNDLAKTLGITRMTACMHIRHLAADGYVRRNEQNKIEFTKKGSGRAEEVVQKYEFFRDLLLRLGIDEQKAQQDAEKLEHDVWSFSALKAYCKL